MVPFRLLFPISVLSGFVGAMSGMGGGIILIPALTLLGVDIKHAIAISILSVIATSSGSASAYVRDHITNLKVGMFIEMFTIVGALVGARITLSVSARPLYITFGIVLLGSWTTLLVAGHESWHGRSAQDAVSRWLELVGGYYDQLLGRIQLGPRTSGQTAGGEGVTHIEHCINSRIAGDGDAPRVDAFGQQVALRRFGGREVQGGEAGGDHAVHLFGKWLRKVAGAQAGFHMAHRNVLVEGRQGAGKRGGGIALHEQHGRLLGLDHRLEGCQDARGDLRECLPWLHQVEVVIRRDFEGGQYLVEHGAVLRGHADTHLKVRVLPQVQ